MLCGKMWRYGSYHKLTIMEQQKLLNADYLDIIFDQRNKSYGGYELRRNYNRRMKKAGLFALLGISAVLSFSFIAIHRKPSDGTAEFDKVVTITTLDIPPKTEKVIPKEITPPPPPPATTRTEKLTPPVITNDDIKPEDQMKPVGVMHDANPGPSSNNIDTAGIGIGSGPVTPKPGTGVVTTPVILEPLKYVDPMPEFNGDLNKYLGEHMVYPEQAKAAGIEGRVGVQFVVNEDGTISNPKLTRGIGAGCDEEALRVISAMPRWKPGKNNGVPVKVYFTQPITFKLD